ncbi:MAG: hypothetical protein HQK87_10890, partial [Nitrospinae bacterium]|nr:hypothetical protein [Nitrospinota bacterium]
MTATTTVTRGRLLPLLALALLLHACGATLDQKTEGGSAQGSVAVQLTWPEGYAYDRDAAALTPPAPESGRAAPSYVTRVVLRVTGLDMDPLLVDVPLDTLTATVTVTLGERTFALLVQTTNGDTFTGARTVVIGP